LNHSLQQSFTTWIDALSDYDLEDLQKQPEAGSWSMGQLYVHLVQSSRFFLDQVKTCNSNNDNADQQHAPAAIAIFTNNELPDMRIEGPPSNKTTPQPNDKERLVRSLTALRDEFEAARINAADSTFKGKTLHPGLKYFNAEEWLKFTDIHLRHHLRQKQRIDEFLQQHKKSRT
jgi:DinB superfamily